jgi:hypothetical protein
MIERVWCRPPFLFPSKHVLLLQLCAGVNLPTKCWTAYRATAVCNTGVNGDIVLIATACYLTSTTTCGGTTATTWTTVTKPTLTISVTQSKVTTVIKPETKTTEALQTATAVTAEISTQTSVSTISITETISTTSVVATATTGNNSVTKIRPILTTSSHDRNRNCHPDSHKQSLRQPISLYCHAT